MPSYDFIQNPIIPGQQQIPPTQQTYQQQLDQYNQHQKMQQKQVSLEPPKIVCKTTGDSSLFSVKEDTHDDAPDDPPKMLLQNPAKVEEKVPTPTNNSKTHVKPYNTNIVGAETGTVEEQSTIDTYYGTTMLLNNTLNQIDMVASEIKTELDQVRQSRTLKRKYDYMVGLSGNLCSLLSAKTNAIRAINNAISKSNDIDYRREKDRMAVETSANDDKYLMDLYNSFVRNPNADTRALGPSTMQTTIPGMSNIVTGNSPAQQAGVDPGYANYINNLTPEQNTMFYESDPNVKTVVVYDASNGNQYFQVMNMATGQVVPNVTVMDNRFLADTRIDLKTKTAKNDNLHETYPVVIINDNITKEY